MMPTTREFTLWALDCLQMPVERQDDQVYRFLTPEGHREALNGAGSVRFTFVDDPDPEHPSRFGVGVEPVAPGSRMFRWLVEQLQSRPTPPHSVPAEDVADAELLAEPLTSAFTVHGGSVRLDACELTPRPLLRLTYQLESSEQNAADPGLCYLHYLPDGARLDDELAESLGLHELRWCSGNGAPAPSDWQPRLDAARRHAETLWESADQQARFLFADLVWCRYAEGQLVAELGSHEVPLPFEGWAGLLARGKQRPAPYRCPVSGMESHHLELADGDRVTVSESLDTCAESGRRVPAEQLETCAATGRRALSEFFTTCPVSGRRVLESSRIRCHDCGQAVSPDALEAGRCSACRALARLSKDDPRMARILGEYPKLDRWSRWRMSETESGYVLTAAGWFRRLLLVLHKDTLEPEHVATAPRFRGGWSETPTEHWQEFLA